MASEISLFESIVNEKGETSVKVKSTLESKVKQELFDSGEHHEDNDILCLDENISKPQLEVQKNEQDDNTLDEIQTVFHNLTGADADDEKHLKNPLEVKKKSGSPLKYDYFDSRPDRKESDGDDDCDDDEDSEDENLVGKKLPRGAANSCPFESLPAWPSTSGKVTSGNEKDADKVEGGPIEQIQHVRKQIKSTKAEIAKLEKMMSHIADLRHALSERDTTQGLNQLAQLSIKDFEEFQTYLMDLPDKEPNKDPSATPVSEKDTPE